MITLLVWVLTIYGMSNILVYGAVLNGFRDTIEKWGENNRFFRFIREMLKCMMCTPTWIGFFAGILLYSPVHEFMNVSNAYSWFLDGCLASGTTWIINSIVEWFEENRPINNNNQIL